MTNKLAATIRVSEEQAAVMAGFERRGHFEDRQPTQEEIDEHDRAIKAVHEIHENRYIQELGDDEYWENTSITVLPLETREWVPDETAEEYVQRWIDAGRPEKPSLLVDLRMREEISAAIMRAIDSSIIAQVARGENTPKNSS